MNSEENLMAPSSLHGGDGATGFLLAGAFIAPGVGTL
jgi:hypothetical protein